MKYFHLQRKVMIFDKKVDAFLSEVDALMQKEKLSVWHVRPTSLVVNPFNSKLFGKSIFDKIMCRCFPDFEKLCKKHDMRLSQFTEGSLAVGVYNKVIMRKFLGTVGTNLPFEKKEEEEEIPKKKEDEPLT